jgi:uncharacterized membrane protein
MIARRTAAIFVFFAACFAAAPASASLKLCNRTSYILYAAVGAAAKSDIVTHGWTWLAPGACETAIATPLKAPAYYVYARSSRSHSGPSRAWGGNARLCVGHGDFTFTAPAFSRCTQDGSFDVPFSEIATQHKSDFTETLTGKPELATLDQARIAGIQRLLSDAGYKLAAIDGNDDKPTETALAAFRRKARLSRKANDEALFKALEKAAGKTAAPAGYAICNATPTPFWAAIGLKTGKEWVSRGWWKVPPSDCSTAIAEPLATDHVYLLADLPGKKPLVTGSAKFCVTDITFEIQGRGNCKQRGMREAGFADTVVKGRNGYVARVGPKGLEAATPARRNNSDANASRHR